MSASNGGLAFPAQMFTRQSDGQPMTAGDFFEGGDGMSLRDWFAGMALGHIPALLDVSDENASCENIAGHAYQIADAMLAARERKEQA